ncbi:serine/threonine-protein kinase WNK4-like, partial [Seriola lalandi dorsalis]
MKEIQALQTRQKEEIEALFTRMGKHPPPSVLSPAVAMAGGRRRLKSKSHKSARSSGQPSPIHSGSPASVQSLHGSESPPKQSSPSASEASETATDASQAVGRLSLQQLRSSPSMPSLSSCST